MPWEESWTRSPAPSCLPSASTIRIAKEVRHRRQGPGQTHSGAGGAMGMPALSRWPQWFARAAGFLVLLTGLAVLLGWALDLAALTRVVPGWAAMRANAALAFALLGAALSLRTVGPKFAGEAAS